MDHAQTSPHRDNVSAPPATPSGRLLGIDFGLRRVGLAISDPMQIIARGLDTLHYKSRKELIRYLVKIVQENEIVKIVIGLPRHMNGSEGDMAKAVRRLMHELATILPVPMVAWDERLSTIQAQRALREMGYAGSASRDEVDRLAAVFILQSYLDSISRT